MLNQKPKANSSNQCQNSLDVLHRLNAIDLTEDQMETYSGGMRLLARPPASFTKVGGIILLVTSVAPAQRLAEEFQADLALLRAA